MIPREDYTVTINADDAEYIDLCAFGKGSEEGAFGKRIQDYYICIFTTERGYGKYQIDGRNLDGWSKNGKIEVELKISCKNAKTCYKDISILDAPDQNGKIVHFQK